MATRELMPGSYLRDDGTLFCVVNMLTDLAVEEDNHGRQVLVHRPDHDVYLLEDCAHDGLTRWHDEERVAELQFLRGPE